jgi:hypothetical protein
VVLSPGIFCVPRVAAVPRGAAGLASTADSEGPRPSLPFTKSVQFGRFPRSVVFMATIRRDGNGFGNRCRKIRQALWVPRTLFEACRASLARALHR